MRADSRPSPDAVPGPTDAEPRPRVRFVTGCQQLLALGAVLAVLTPAATVVTMDVVPRSPGGDAAAEAGRFSAYARSAAAPAAVASGAVAPEVTEYQLTAPKGARSVPGGLAAKVTRAKQGGQQVVSKPQAVLGDGTLGVTWSAGQEVDEDAVKVQVRTRGDRWSAWKPLAYHAEHGPDPESAEAKSARPGTEPIFVGDVDKVQVRMITPRSAPSDLRLAVVDPGRAQTREEAPEIDTSDSGATSRESTQPEAESTQAGSGEETGGGDDLALQRARFTPKPRIFSRRQWGADESLRDKGSLRYHEVHAGFVHHTVNANGYSKSQVPGILRGIYAYHTQSRGWSDIGYNFLVDKFGRIWEGRAGGVARPVVGAHTLGYNHLSFAMSAIGNFETAQPRAAMLQAYGALYAWKLSLHGVHPMDQKQRLGSSTFKGISGHRDAGSTACPGRYLYEKLPRIRRLARDAFRWWSGRELEDDMMSGPMPDLVVRRAKDGAGMVLPLKSKDGRKYLGRPKPIGHNFSGAQKLMSAGDWDRNGHSDILFRRKSDLALFLVRQKSDGSWAQPLQLRKRFGGKLMGAVGDWDGDGWPDLVAQRGKSNPTLLFPGKGARGLRKARVMRGPIDGGSSIPVGRWDRDGAPDFISRKGRGLTMQLGNGPGGITRARSMGRQVGNFDWVVGVSHTGITKSAHSDLVVRRRSDSRVFILPGTASGLQKAVRVGKSWRAKRFDMVG